MRRPRSGLVAPVLAFVFPLLNTPSLVVPPWTGRLVLLVAVAVTGVGLLAAALMRHRQADSVAAAALLAWAGLSALASHKPAMALWGMWSWGTGWLFTAGLVGAWLLGRSTDERGSHLTEVGLVAAVVINACVGIAQVLFDLSKASLGLDEGRAYGLLGNSVFFSGVMLAGLWLAMHSRWRTAVTLTITALVGCALQLSGSRLTIALAVVGLASAATIRGKSIVLIMVALALGLGAGTAVAHAKQALTSSQRLAEGAGGGLRARTEAWLSATHAIEDRPMLGAGPGRFQAATSKYRTLAFARAEGPGKLYLDAHNLVVEYATTTGIPGVALLLVWLAVALRRAGPRSPLGAAATGLLLVHLLEPQSVASTPVAFLVLGAAAPGLDLANTRLVKAGLTTVAALGIGLAGVLGYGFYAMNQATLDFNRSWALVADRNLPPWPDPKEIRARIAVLHALETHQQADLDKALPYRQAATKRDPSDPVPLETLAMFELQLGRRGEAARHFSGVLQLNPWAPNSLNALGRLYADAGRREDALVLLKRSLQVVPEQPGTRRLVAALDGG